MIAIRERFDRFPKTFTFDCPQLINARPLLFNP
jgi:hypothetical protein